MSTDLVSEMVGEGMLAEKQAAERRYEFARGRVEQVRAELAKAQADLIAARQERKTAREQYEDDVRARRKPRQRNIVRRIISSVVANPGTRAEIVERTGLDATTVSSTLTRLRRAGFVHRDGTDYAGKWVASPSGLEFMDGDAPFPKEHRG